MTHGQVILLSNQKYTVIQVHVRSHRSLSSKGSFLTIIMGNSLSDLGIGLAKRGIWHLHHSRGLMAYGPHNGSKEELERLLPAAMKIIP